MKVRVVKDSYLFKIFSILLAFEAVMNEVDINMRIANQYYTGSLCFVDRARLPGRVA